MLRNHTQSDDYVASLKEQALEEENKKLEELLGKKELELNMLQEPFKKRST